jgi:hypothetical protein
MSISNNYSRNRQGSHLIVNSDGADTSADGYVPDGILVVFTAPDGGAIDPLHKPDLR